jgi:hypothetical protein
MDQKTSGTPHESSTCTACYALLNTCNCPLGRVIQVLLDQIDDMKAASPPSNVVLPGKLGNPTMQLKDDPRVDPRILAAGTPLGFASDAEPIPLTRHSPMEEILGFCAAAEMGFAALGQALYPEGQHNKLSCEVEASTEVIKGVDGNDIKLYIHKPKGATNPMPAVVHTHGGAMAILQAADGVQKTT